MEEEMTDTNHEKINRLLAEHVMGWRLDYSSRQGGFWLDKDGLHIENTNTDYFEEKWYSEENWNPTSDLNQAFECVEKIIGEGHVDILVGEPRIGSTTCKITTDRSAPTWKTLGVGISENPALAICLCLLKAKEIEVPSE